VSTKKTSFSAYLEAMHSKCIEPKPRRCGGRFGYVWHRFPIKGGVSWREVMWKQAGRPNPLFEMVKIKEEATSDV
jgi:hypothetical protein